ncbi:alpha/beta fold hydrolase [Nocardioides marmoriginsengisoli]|uniref:alpha/beta fold hydrolase n=1 Tax=Nocardioides marmoriginsengisoli TaxID=661483 RepID=UPI001C83B9DA|nr:alpha/beta fold hydrolase [Nocardioides marmoriginsengisoli]
MPPAAPSEFLERVNRELSRSAVRAQYGLKHLSGLPMGKVGVTPKTAVWQRDRVTLYRYADAGIRHGTPILLVMSLVTRPYVFDLRPGGSLVEDLLARGFDVFLLDWGVPDVSDSQNSLETYCDEYIPHAAAAVRRIAGADQLTLFGYCLGAVLCLIAAAGNPQMSVRNLVGLATPIDFERFGPIANLLREGRMDPDQMLDETGNVPPSVMLNAIRMLQPSTPIASRAGLWRGLENAEALSARQAIIGWSTDHIPLPGKLFQQIVDLFIRGGALITGRVPLGSRMVELSMLECRVLSVVGERDQLVPPECTEPLADALGSVQLDSLSLRAGHAGLFVGSQARKTLRSGHRRLACDDFVRGSND